jgi:hypothetical protein
VDDGADSVKLYIDGVLDKSDEGSLRNPNRFPCHPVGYCFELQFGGYYETHDVRYFQGQVDEVSLYNRALSSDEIQGIFLLGSLGKCGEEDSDGDGYRPPEDCDDTDPNINPNTAEISFNFVDENCDGNLGDCDPCAAWASHGAYVRCVSDAVSNCSTNTFLPEEADAFVSSAVRSDIGKKGFVPPECAL